MAKKKGLTDTQLLALCQGEKAQAKSITETVNSDREKVFDYYEGKPYGDEADGLSQVVTTEFRDTVESILPLVLQFMVGIEEPFEFLPNSEEDVDQARQETEMVKHVFFQHNEGFLILYSWIKDALMLKNGIVKAYWDERTDYDKETYQGKTYGEFLKAAESDDVEVLEATVRLNGQEYSVDEFADLLGGAVPDGAEQVDFVLKCKVDASQEKVECVKPEKFNVSARQTSLDLRDCDYCNYIDDWSYSDLRAEGFTPEQLDGLAFKSGSELSSVEMERAEETSLRGMGGDNDPARRLIEVTEHYIRTDLDGDGLTELLYMLEAGGKMLRKQEIDRIPFRATTPIINTHRFYGVSVFDLVKDLQLVNSTLLRGMLDNLYLTNRPMHYLNMQGVSATAQDTIDDILNWRANGVVRGDGPYQERLQTLAVPFTAGATLPVFQYLEELREQRTGISKTTQGLDPNAFKENTNMVGMGVMNAAMQRIKMIARILLETGLKGLMLDIREDLMKNAKRADYIALEGQYVEVDPREWKTKRNTRIKVGTGYASRDEKLAATTNMLTLYEKAIAIQGGQLEGPFTSADRLFNLLRDHTENMGIQAPSRYWRDPATFRPQPAVPPKDPVEVAEAEVMATTQEKAARLQLDATKHKDDVRLKETELTLKYGVEAQKLGLDAARSAEDTRRYLRKETTDAQMAPQQVEG